MEEAQFISIDHDIDEIIKTCKLFRFQLELSQKSNSDKESQLRKIISDLEVTAIKTDESPQLRNILSSFSDRVYNQPWNKLKPIHKEDRLKKYVELKYETNKEKNNILKIIMDGLNEGIFNKVNSVEYDVKTAKITNIPILVENENNSSFTLKKKLK
jgi:hypothetical protein